MMVLLTGGAGYIGSHTAVELLMKGYEVVIFDNFSNSNINVIDRIEAIVSREVSVVQGDVRGLDALGGVIRGYGVESVVHFAAKKSISESILCPIDYFDNNVNGANILLHAMLKTGVKKFVFSSSAAVYGNPQYLPLDEAHPIFAANMYGETKAVVEKNIFDFYRGDPSWSFSILRYFNPIGAHESGMIGEDSLGVPDNLLPLMAQVVMGKYEYLNIYGSDYKTPDGTGVRDYIHVVDLARAHVKALERQVQQENPEYLVMNLGAGRGYSVLEVMRAFEKASGHKINYVMKPRRFADVAICYSKSEKAQVLLDWRAELNLDKMCADAWRWQSKNPRGYRD